MAIRSNYWIVTGYFAALIGVLVGGGSQQCPAMAPTLVSGDDLLWDVDPTWKPVEPAEAESLLQDYLKSLPPNAARDAAVRAEWKAGLSEGAGPDEILDRLVASLAKSDDRAEELFALTTTADYRQPLPELAWLADSATHPLARNNLRLYLARWLVQEGYYDEAISWLEGLKPGDVVAPATLLFYRAVAHHQIVEPNETESALSQLLQRSEELPLRYQKVAALMQQDIAGLEEDSLDHIARRMGDIRRRLELGRAGEKVQQVETGVIESLDKLIEEAEKQLQQQQQAQAASSGGPPGGAPMQDSQLPGGIKGAGKVEQRDVGDESGWGNLPEKDREKALQDIGREFPSHYREVIQEYFRRLAAEESSREE